MTAARKILTVFLASPGDLGPEREAAKKFVDEWNAVNSARLNWMVDLLGWEDTLPQAGRPQAIINQDVERCSLFIGMMWKWWGTPPARKDSIYTSGFEEEFEVARRLRSQYGRPQMAMFFKDPGPINDAGPSLSRVIEFKEALREGREFLYKELRDDPVAWGDEFRSILHKLIFDEIEKIDSEERGRQPQTMHRQPTETTSSPTQGSRVKVTTIEARAREISNKSDAELTGLEIAKLRLTALATLHERLSTSYLEVHDVNILFKNRDDLRLESFERVSLIHAALVNVGHDNKPLWAWSNNDPDIMIRYLSHAIGYDEDDVAVGALKTLTIIAAKLQPEFTERFYSRIRHSSARYRNAAFSYLARVGCVEDLDIVDEFVSRDQYGFDQLSASAAILIRSRSSEEEAIGYLLNRLQVLPSGPVRDIFPRRIFSAATPDLRVGLNHRDSEVRAACARELRRRHLLTTAEIESLKLDPESLVRAEAALSLIEAGQMDSLQTAERIVKPGLFGQPHALAGLGLAAATDQALELVRRAYLAQQSDAALSNLATSTDDNAPLAYGILGDRQFEARATQIRSDVDTSFGEHPLVQDRSDKNVLASLLEPPPAERRRNLLQAATQLLVRHGDATDIGRVRSSLRDHGIKLEATHIHYLRKHGSESDVTIIDEILNKPTGLYIPLVDKTLLRQAGLMVYDLLERDLDRIAAKEFSSTLLRTVLSLAEKSRLRKASSESILALMNHADDQVRKLASVRFGSTLGKGYIKKTLETTLAQERYYYNTVYWLDTASVLSRASMNAVDQWVREGG